MALVHFTHKKKWEKIQEDGFIQPKIKLSKFRPTGGDVDKVSAFTGFDIECAETVSLCKFLIADAKNQNPFISVLGEEEPWKSDDVVGLVLNTEKHNVTWVECPNQKKELGMVTWTLEMTLPEDFYRNIGEYVKNVDSIPVDCVIKVI